MAKLVRKHPQNNFGFHLLQVAMLVCECLKCLCGGQHLIVCMSQEFVGYIVTFSPYVNTEDRKKVFILMDKCY